MVQVIATPQINHVAQAGFGCGHTSYKTSLVDTGAGIRPNWRSPSAENQLIAARQGALDAGDPASYALAAQRAAQLAQAQGDTASAYARLATAWATLRDAVGPQAAQAACQPLLQALKADVGDSAFLAAKALYEARRKA